jgi:hypothetical protein
MHSSANVHHTATRARKRIIDCSVSDNLKKKDVSEHNRRKMRFEAQESYYSTTFVSKSGTLGWDQNPARKRARVSRRGRGRITSKTGSPRRAHARSLAVAGRFRASGPHAT